jgi:glycolate oxidase iron-sulfur subunit
MTPASTPGPRPLAGSPLAAAAAGLDQCVHCGFCLPSCPTYTALDDENDSPRGRLVLMRALLDGAVAPTDADVRRPLDRCLGCRACEPACPSGVPYGHLLEATRATLAARAALPWIARAVLAVFARPWALRVALAAARAWRDLGMARALARAPGRIGVAHAMLASTARPRAVAPRAAPVPEPPADTPEVLAFPGCVMTGLFAPVHEATERVLRWNGFRVADDPGTRCCGALHAHAGDAATARALARANIAALERRPAATIAVNAAGCGAMLKEYGHLLHDDAAWAPRAVAVAARVRDVSEVLAAAGPRPTVPYQVTVTYDAPCHLQHAQRVVTPPLAVLAAIDGLHHLPLADSDRCCGSAGIYNLVEPDVADRVLAPKLDAIAATGAPIVLTGNPGCLMQIGAGLLRRRIPAVARHPVEVLDAAYATVATDHAPR